MWHTKNLVLTYKIQSTADDSVCTCIYAEVVVPADKLIVYLASIKLTI